MQNRGQEQGTMRGPIARDGRAGDNPRVGAAPPLVGVIGGMSWESTATYYRAINEGYRRRLGGHHSAPLLVHSVDFAPIEAMQRSGDWDGTAGVLADAARGLERAGAGLLLLATNTMHLVFDALTEATTVPWLHIADACGSALARAGVRRAGLLGTRFTMEEAFYRDRLAERFDVDVHVPEESARREIDRIIFEELVHGAIRDESRKTYAAVMRRMANHGVEAIILGCTEIGLLVGPDDGPVPLFDTARLHAEAAVAWLLGDDACGTHNATITHGDKDRRDGVARNDGGYPDENGAGLRVGKERTWHP